MGVNCEYCSKPILGRIVQAFEKSYHPEHLLCAQCGHPILTERFYEHNGKPYCAKDNEQFLPKCRRCNAAITGRGIQAKGKTYHKDCFQCDRCGVKLIGKACCDCCGCSGKPFFENNGQFQCKKCKRETGPHCNVCDKPLGKVDLEALGKHWHPKCFKCSKCKKRIKSEQFSVAPSGEPLCMKCA